MEETKDEEKPPYGKGNRGEWSELYVLLKLLADGEMYESNENAEKVESRRYPVSAINHKTTKGKDICYEILKNSKIRVSLNDSEVEPNKISSIAKDLLKSINEAKDRSFEIPSLNNELEILKFPKLKAFSQEKQDISIVIYDTRLCRDQEVGFSIKSQLGSRSTLFNAGKNTHFLFEVTGLEKLEKKFIKSLENKKNKGLIKTLVESGCEIKFIEVGDDRFDSNIALIDTNFKYIWSFLLEASYKSSKNKIKDLVKILIKENPLDFKERDAENFYTYKIKQFLTAVALGMTASNLWQGLYDASGGYIIVKKDGELACYHIYNWNAFQDYLFANTCLDGPSTGKHESGTLYQKDGKYFVNLNLQIRFTS